MSIRLWERKPPHRPGDVIGKAQVAVSGLNGRHAQVYRRLWVFASGGVGM